jgi:hypothetical protein
MSNLVSFPYNKSMRIFFNSCGLNLGIVVENPVPIPCVPFTKIIGIIGKIYSGIFPVSSLIIFLGKIYKNFLGYIFDIKLLLSIEIYLALEAPSPKTLPN